HLQRGKVPVERIRPIPVIDDDEVAIAAELVRIRNGPLVDGMDGASFRQRDLDAVADEGRPEAVRALPPEPAGDDAVGGPGPRALERPEGQADGGPGAAGRDLRERRLQPLLRVLELAGQLRVEVAAFVDRRDEGAAGGDGAVHGGTRLLRFRLK